MIAKQIIKEEIKEQELEPHPFDILDSGIAGLIDENLKNILMSKEIGLTDYAGMIFKGEYEAKEIKGYGSFAEYYDLFEPAEINCPEPYK